uniref:Major facilitator superfamily domain containing 4B n=1 Tax=Homo sapiens TaxID=9606 RepID=A0A5K1VW69_HUMAN
MLCASFLGLVVTSLSWLFGGTKEPHICRPYTSLLPWVPFWLHC